MFRALSARARYLSLYRPDIMFAAKELCRELSCPGRSNVRKLKRLVRYLVKTPRLIWRYDFDDTGQHLDIFF